MTADSVISRTEGDVRKSFAAQRKPVHPNAATDIMIRTNPPKIAYSSVSILMRYRSIGYTVRYPFRTP